MSRKRTALEGTNLVLPWRPLYDLFQSTYFTGSRSRAYEKCVLAPSPSSCPPTRSCASKLRKPKTPLTDHSPARARPPSSLPRRLPWPCFCRRHAVVILWLVQYARRYFAEEATAELLRLFRPQLTPGNSQIYIAHCYVVRFMPTNRPALIAAWLPDVISTWAWVQHVPDWDTQWLTFMARYVPLSETGVPLAALLTKVRSPLPLGRVAEDNVGNVDWTPYLGFIFSIILQSFGVSVGSNRPTAIRPLELPQESHVFLKLQMVRVRNERGRRTENRT